MIGYKPLYRRKCNSNCNFFFIIYPIFINKKLNYHHFFKEGIYLIQVYL